MKPGGAIVLPFRRRSARISARTLAREPVRLEVVRADELAGRPRTRGDCAGGPRPCPWVGCRHNLYLDAAATGSITMSAPELDPDEVPAGRSCSLDVADRGGVSLEDVAEVLGVTRERARQIEERALAAVRTLARWDGTAAAALGEFRAPRVDGPARRVPERSVLGEGEGLEDEADEADEDEADELVGASFFLEPGNAGADARACAAVWSAWSKDSNGRGFECRSKASKAASRAVARRKEGGGAMTRAELLATVDEWKATHGGFAPTSREVFELLGASVAKSPSNVSKCARLAGIALGTSRRGPIAKAKRVDAAVPKAAELPAVSIKLGGVPVVEALAEVRDRLHRGAAALEVAIDAIRGAS